MLNRGLLGFIIAVSIAVPAALAQSLMGSPAFITSQVSVGTSATLVAPSRPSRWRINIATTGTNQVYCGPNNGVTAGNGYPIPPTAMSSIGFDTRGEVWCIAAATQIVAVLETY